jgi:peptide/nickel transport system ATP-binding protein
MNKDQVLSIRELRFGYSAKQLLFDDFTLELRRGEVCAVVGPSGAGKSTLFDLVSGELKPLSGSIRSGRIAQVYQDPYTSFHHSYPILSQIGDVASLEGMSDYLEILELEPELLDKKPYELSGGQLQRCSILRALLMKPDLILADEPTSALDNIIQLGVMQLLMKFLDRVGILLITHDENLAVWASDRIVRVG